MPQYYELKDENKLPITGRFVDPYDGAVFTPHQKETLTQFISRISDARAAKGHPEFFPHEVKMLVVLTLAETCSKQDLRTFFTPTYLTPEFSQVLNVAKTIVQQRFYFHQADYLTRQERAQGCKDCKLHRPSSNYSTTVSESLKKMAGLKELAQSDLEKSLGLCGMCGCDLRAKVGFDIQGILAALTPEQLRSILLLYGVKAFESCWILRESLEDPALHKILEKKVSFSGDRTKGMLNAYRAEKIARARLNGSQNR